MFPKSGMTSSFLIKIKKLAGSKYFENWIMALIHLGINFNLFAKNQFTASKNFIKFIWNLSVFNP